MGQGPGLEFVDQGLALGFVGSGIGTHLLQPLLNHFVGLVASAVKALPQAMVGQPPLIGLLPLFAQLAQSLLHFSPAHDRLRWGRFGPFGCGRGRLEQGLGFLDQLGAQLIGAPALPTLQFASGQQDLVRVVLPPKTADEPAPTEAVPFDLIDAGEIARTFQVLRSNFSALGETLVGEDDGKRHHTPSEEEADLPAD